MKKLLATILVTCMCVSTLADTAPIRLIVPWTPGGGGDISARILAKHWAKETNNSIVVENHPGGNTSIGSQLVVKAPADGRTLLISSPGTIMSSTKDMQVPAYDYQKDLKPVAIIAWATPFVLAVPTSKNFKDFATFEKALKTNRLNYGTPVAGGMHRLMGEMLASPSNSRVEQIVYKGQGPVNQDLVGGVIDFTFATSYAVAALIESGRVQVLATADEYPAYGAPTMESLGYKNFSLIKEYYGVWAPAGTPEETIKQLRKDIHKLARGPVNKEMTDMGFANTRRTINDNVEQEQQKMFDRINELNRRFGQ